MHLGARSNFDHGGGFQIRDSGIELTAVPLLLLLFRTQLERRSGPAFVVGRGKDQVIAAWPHFREPEVSFVVCYCISDGHKVPLPIHHLPLLRPYVHAFERLFVLIFDFAVDMWFGSQLQNYGFALSGLNRHGPRRYRELLVIEESGLSGNRRVASRRKIIENECSVGSSELRSWPWRVDLSEGVGHRLAGDTIDHFPAEFDHFGGVLLHRRKRNLNKPEQRQVQDQG